MFNLIITALTEIVGSIDVTSGWLRIMALIVACMLMGSPGTIATFIAFCVKIGIYNHAKAKGAASES